MAALSDEAVAASEAAGVAYGSAPARHKVWRIEQLAKAPAALDDQRVAERVTLALTLAGVRADTPWTHLRALLPASTLSAALEDLPLARLGCGVVVPTDQAGFAARVLETADITTASWVACTRHDSKRAVPWRPPWRTCTHDGVESVASQARRHG
ncbi:hypothetical protein [Embleya scabrispora]|uniref:hypothetical protein n=1 Tax=Embleya scabrispora TaxID=159449 RepID=UPI001180D541|nr:hypothetical protein [Embleya scabrispora]